MMVRMILDSLQLIVACSPTFSSTRFQAVNHTIAAEVMPAKKETKAYLHTGNLSRMLAVHDCRFGNLAGHE